MTEMKTKEDAERMIKEKVDEFAQKMSEFTDQMTDEIKRKFSKQNLQQMLRNDESSYTYLKFIIAFLVILFIFVFFGYKLYKSLVEKERRREEKKKQKQQKKKK